VEVDKERHERLWKERHKAIVAHQRGEFTPEMLAHVLCIERFEGAVLRLVKQNQDRHHRTQGHRARTMALLNAIRQTVRMPHGFKRLANVIDSAEKFEYTHSEALF
jgi:hypothetical protein